MAGALYGTFGGTSFPLPVADVTDSLAVLDPACTTLAQLFKAAINHELGAVWTKVTNTLPAAHALRGTDPVEDVLELEPSPQIMTQRRAGWPLLCVYRTGRVTVEQHTIDTDRLTQTWTVDYILGPLDVGEVRKVGGACRLVGAVIQKVIRQRGHSAYQDGRLQFFGDTCGLASIELKGAEGPGQASFVGDDKGPLYYAITFTLETTEMCSEGAEEFGSFDGIDYTVNVGDRDSLVNGLIYAST